MGERGPVPKRSTQRHGHHKTEPVDTAADGVATVPAGAQRGRVRRPPAQQDWHPMAKRWYLALGRSGQADWYQPSDWEEAAIGAEMLSRQLYSDKPSAMMIVAWTSMSARLLATEGDRRRVRIELERAPAETDPAQVPGVAFMDAWRGKLAGSV